MTLTLTDSNRLKESNGLEPTTPEAVGDWWCYSLVEMHTTDDGDDMWRQTYVVIYRRRACTTDHTADHQDCLWCYYPVFFFGSYATISCLLFIFSLAALLLSCCCFWAVNFMAVGQLFKCKPSADNSSNLGSKTSHAPTWFYLPRTIEEWTYLLTCLLTYLLANTLDLFTGRHVPCCWYDVDHRCLLVKAWFWQIWEAFSFRLEKGLVSQRDYI